MKRSTLSTTFARSLWLALAMTLLSGAALAQFERLPTTRPGPNAAQVYGSPGQPAQELFEVKFIGINGRNINARDVLWLEPGNYELKVLIEASFARSSPGPGPSFGARRRQPEGYNIIEVELEAGKRYQILARFNRTPDELGRNYSVILHKVDG